MRAEWGRVRNLNQLHNTSLEGEKKKGAGIAWYLQKRGGFTFCRYESSSVGNPREANERQGEGWHFRIQPLIKSANLRAAERSTFFFISSSEIRKEQNLVWDSVEVKKKMLVLSHSLHHHLFFLISNYISSVMWKLLNSSVSKWYIVGNKLDLLPELHYNAQEHILLTYFTPPELSDGFSYDEMRLHKYEILLLSILWVHFPHHTYILLFKVL